MNIYYSPGTDSDRQETNT